MIEVFFRGYGCWFVYHRYSRTTFQILHLDDNENRFFVTPGDPNNVDFKFDLTCIETIGLFTMTKEDAFEYRRTGNHSMVRKLNPSPRYHSAGTFIETTPYSFFKDIFDNTITKITEQIQIGGMWIDAADCYFLIDAERLIDGRPFVFEAEYYVEPINTKNASQEKTTPNKPNQTRGGHHTLDSREETTYQNIIAALLASITGDLPNTVKHPSFATPQLLIEIINKHYKGPYDLSESSLYDYVVVKPEDKDIAKNDSREKEIYQNLIGVLLECIKGRWPDTVKHPSYRGQGLFINLIVEAYKDSGYGLSESNLSRKFPKAKNSLLIR